MLPFFVDLPSYLQNVTYNITSYSVNEYSVRVQWKAPSDDGGVGISNYTITITTEGKTNVIFEITNGTLQVVSLQYNEGYIFEVAASNCNGKGQHTSCSIRAGTIQMNSVCNVTLHFFQSVVSCGHPCPPANGTIEPYSSTQVGAEVQYHCDEGHTSREWSTFQCQENGSWVPDPALVNCVMGMCIFHVNMHRLLCYITLTRPVQPSVFQGLCLWPGT